MNKIYWVFISLRFIFVVTALNITDYDASKSDADYKLLSRHKRQLMSTANLERAYDCMNLQCLCPYFGGSLDAVGQCTLPSGRPLSRAVRKELRALTEDERSRIFNAFKQLKQRGEYDRLSTIHRTFSKESGAHFGPSFLIWHREYLKRVEIALRLIDPTVAVPYWDSVMDGYLPDPKDSTMWTSQLLGATDFNGNVINGPFADFRTLEGHPRITRLLGLEGHLSTESNIKEFLSQDTIENILAATAPKRGCPHPPFLGAIEYRHASVHLWVGGDMKPPSTAANDPIFFFHHGFVDYVYELWRQMKQSRQQREIEFPVDNEFCQDPKHFASSIMHPFRKRNIDGLSNAYTDFLYTYAPHPKCNRVSPDCHSPLLFCDLNARNPRCVAKIKLGGRCDGFEGEDACLDGICVNSQCQRIGSSQDTNRVQARLEQLDQVRKVLPNRRLSNLFTNAKMFENCLNEEPCCGMRARQGECVSSPMYMRQYCRRSCGFCRTNDRSNGCEDRHHRCGQWSSSDQCVTRQQWMAENCRSSCGWCHLSVEQFCLRRTAFN